MAVFPGPKDYIFYEGRSFTAEWYYTIDGVMPAFDYYKELTEMDMKRFGDIVEYFCDRAYGTLLPKTWYRVEDPRNDIYAFKPRDERFFNFITAGRKVIITNAYHKHSQQMSKQDLEQLKIATRYRGDYFHRIKEGTYNER